MNKDGIHAMLPYEAMSHSAKKMRDFYAMKPNAPLYQKEFGFYCMERWIKEGHLKPDHTSQDLAELFGYDVGGKYFLGELGWCEAGFLPVFEEVVIEDRGEYEVVQDFAGRHVLCFKNRRSGFMPEYLEHPVKDQKSWEEKCKWRMNADSPERYTKIAKKIEYAKAAAGRGDVICQNLVGGYMYLRSLLGPLELLYAFYDQPELIHDCMQTWFKLADKIIAKHQEHVSLDEIFIAEDICYNHGLLISGDMVREFLFPYYQQLLSNAKNRQLDPNRKLYFQVDTDGFSDVAITLYQELGMDFLSPFEVAAGCDVLRTAGEYPELLISGGIDKRILAQGKDAIDRELDRIIPPMKKRGGYIPTCDHGVPEEVSFENYMHYRKRMLEYNS